MTKNTPFVLTRRGLIGGALSMSLSPLRAASHSLTLICAPSNLGLRSLRAGHEPGAWRAPQALRQAGLDNALKPGRVMVLDRPTYRFEAQAGTNIRNGFAIRRFSEKLSLAVSQTLGRGSFPVVIGGDCSVLLGCLLGARSSGAFGLVHIDGHSDFSHPGNQMMTGPTGAAAGMDLALATGRGEPMLAMWNGRPLVDDDFVVQIGEREELEPDYYKDIIQTTIRRFPVRKVLRSGINAVVEQVLAPVRGQRRPMWVHVDLDVLDERVMPAVDSPGRPGLNFEQLTHLLAALRASGRVIGIDVAIYDPERDRGQHYAPAIVECLRRGLTA